MFQELVRRKMFREVAIYLAGSWALIEVADIVFPRLGMPEWAVTFVIVLVLTALPLVALLAWLFDAKGWTLQRTPDAPDRNNKYARATLGIGSVVVVVSASLITLQLHERGSALEEISVPVAERQSIATIAVLPFLTAGGSDDDIHGESVALDTLYRLSHLEGLTVVSRNSSFRAAERGLPLPELASLLGATTVLEGHVSHAAEGSVLAAQLFNQDGRSLWANTYGLEGRAVAAITSELATDVVEALELSLTTEEGILLRSGRLSESPRATRAYIEGRRLAALGTPESLTAAIAAYERAMSIDPGFARALFAMSHAQMQRFDAYHDQTWATEVWQGRTSAPRTAGSFEAEVWEGWNGAREQLSQALEMDPGIGDAYALVADMLWPVYAARLVEKLARIREVCPSCIAQAREYRLTDRERLYRVALAKDPSSAFVNSSYGQFLLLTGRLEEGIAYLRDAAALEPLSWEAEIEVAQAAVWIDDLEQAEEALTRARGRGVPNESLVVASIQARIEFARLVEAGDLEAVRSWWLEAWDRLYERFPRANNPQIPDAEERVLIAGDVDSIVASLAGESICNRTECGRSDGFGLNTPSILRWAVWPLTWVESLSLVGDHEHSWGYYNPMGRISADPVGGHIQATATDDGEHMLAIVAWVMGVLDGHQASRIDYKPHDASVWGPLAAPWRQTDAFAVEIERGPLPELWDEVGWPDFCERTWTGISCQ